ncbi:hypothetical protein N7474_010162 [Penicillium riverlandense]|uniref:uncharacterized protein n=1 Tax=Penicillium riverlandense TaxID=1903569 RepID=UPI0025480F3D|nr:uncharacterized protein N7474_010162 [Penicillium riverlandense]KAJ5808893.1 hypothetical protein N7474_010162 [Penicillium riverlandense]
MITPEGPHASKGLTFGSLRHNFASLAERACFRTVGKEVYYTNILSAKASEATRGQALDH